MGLTMLLLAATAVVAVIDWWAVAVDARRVEYVAKPLTLILLIGVAAAIDPSDSTQREWFVGALVASLVGDVALMLPSGNGNGGGTVSAVSSPPMTFIVGLLAFLIGHLGYVGGFLVGGDLRAAGFAIGAAVVLVAALTVGLRIIRATRASGERAITIAVTAYLVVIGTMVVVAYGTLEVLAIVGATLFFASDAMIGWTRFVTPVRHGRVAIMVTYHLGQAGLVLSLLQ